MVIGMVGLSLVLSCQVADEELYFSSTKPAEVAVL